ncbi:hypothetical protein HUJ04_012039 [Dendroctonus ponderosae]|nr:hypothetical protein HUJ04_012039 [Dendroctonus ponderosae]
MAESRGSLLAKSVQKHAGRAKEKVGDSVVRWPHLQGTIAALQSRQGIISCLCFKGLGERCFGSTHPDPLLSSVNHEIFRTSAGREKISYQTIAVIISAPVTRLRYHL